MLDLRREKAHFGGGSVSLRRGCEQVMIGSFLTLRSSKVRILDLLILRFSQTVVFCGSRESLSEALAMGRRLFHTARVDIQVSTVDINLDRRSSFLLTLSININHFIICMKDAKFCNLLCNANFCKKPSRSARTVKWRSLVLPSRSSLTRGTTSLTRFIV